MIIAKKLEDIKLIVRNDKQGRRRPILLTPRGEEIRELYVKLNNKFVEREEEIMGNNGSAKEAEINGNGNK